MSKKLTTIKTETTDYFEIDRQEMIEIMKKYFKINTMYKDIKIEFKVPSGGDWSGENVDIDQKNPIRVTIIYVDNK